MIDIEEAIKINILCVFYATMHTFTPYMSMKDNFGAEFLICEQLRADAQTLSGFKPHKKRAAVATLLYLARMFITQVVLRQYIFLSDATLHFLKKKGNYL